MAIDASVYPDRDPPTEFATIEEKADYLHRICSAFDFWIPPRTTTVHLLREWKEVFERFPLPHSPAYHALRAFFGWPRVEHAAHFGEPGYVKPDAAEGRTDGFEERV